MPDKQVRIDLVAQDDASADIRKVAGELEQLEDGVTVPVDAETRPAQRSVDDLLETVQHLSGEDATIVLALRAGSVQRELAETLQTVERLDASDPQVQVELAHAADVRADLDKLETRIKDLNQTTVSPKVDTSGVAHYTSEAGKAQDATHSFVGNALSELPGVGTTFGPLSEAVGQMTEGLLAGEVAIGGLVAAAGPIAAVTIGVKLITDAIARHNKAMEEARKRTESWVKALEDADGVRLDAINRQLRDLISTNQDFADSVAATNDVFEFTAQDIADALDGDVSPALQRVVDFAGDFHKLGEQIKFGTVPEPQVERRWKDIADAYGLTLEQVKQLGPEAVTLTRNLEDQDVALGNATTATKNQKDAVKGLRDQAKQAKQPVDDLTDSVDLATDAADRSADAFDAMSDALDMETDIRELETDIGGMALKIAAGAKVSRDEIATISQKVIDVGRDLKRTPLEVSTVLDMVSKGQLDSALAIVQGWANQNPVGVSLEIQRSQILDQLAALGIAVGNVSVSGVGGRSAVPSVIVNQTFPRGFRTTSAVAEAQRAAGRAGRLYMRGHLPR